MSTLFLMVTITDRRSTDDFLQLYQEHGVNISLRTVGSGTAVRQTLSALGLEKNEKRIPGPQSGVICAGKCASMCRARALHSRCR